MGLAGGVELLELASGVDSFYMSGRGVLDEQRGRDLAAARDEARMSRVSVPLELGDCSFTVGASGLNRYEFRLDHAHGVMGVTTSAALPTVVVQPRASFIHGVGIWPALKWFQLRAQELAGPLAWKASRIDLFMDSHGWGVSSEDRSRFVCRSRERVTYEDEETLRTLMFGKPKSGIKARIYDKTEESRKKGTDWWPDVWGPRYLPGERVIRVEFQVMREALRQAGIDAPEQGLERLGELWAYLTEDWLSLRDPTADHTRSRWPVSAEWLQIQQATLRVDAVGLERVHAGSSSGSLRLLMPQLRGYLASAAVHLGAETLEDCLERVKGPIEEYGLASGRVFEAVVSEKRRAVGA